MARTLKTIQTLSRFARVIATIVFVCSIIGAVGSAVGVVAIAVVDIMGIDLTAFSEILEITEPLNLDNEYYVEILALIYCIGEIIVSKAAISYFKSEIYAGTPFTHRGANEMRRLSVFAVVVPIAVSFAQSLAISVLSLFIENTQMVMSYEADISLGIFLLVLSVIFKYGAEITEQAPGAHGGI